MVLPAALLLLQAVDLRRPFRWREALRATAPHWALLGSRRRRLRRLAHLPAHARDQRRRCVHPERTSRPTSTRWPGSPARWSGSIGSSPTRRSRRWTGGAPALVVEGLPAPRRRSPGRSPRCAAARPSSFGILWFLLWLPPTGWWLPRPDPANERQLYLSLAGPAWLAGLWLSPWVAAGGVRRAIGGGPGDRPRGASPRVRSLVYADEIRFWEDVVAKAPAERARPRQPGIRAGRPLPDRRGRGGARPGPWRSTPDYVRAAVNLRLLREGAPLGPGEPRCPQPQAPPP